MAFSGLNVTFGWILATAPTASTANNMGYTQAPAPIHGPSSASQNLASANTTTVAATKGKTNQFLPYVSLIASADWWVTIGPNPADPSVDSPTGGRRLIPAYSASAGQTVDIFVNVGDKVRGAPVA